MLLIELLWLTASSYTPSADLYNIYKLNIAVQPLSHGQSSRPACHSNHSEVASNDPQAPALASYAMPSFNTLMIPAPAEAPYKNQFKAQALKDIPRLQASAKSRHVAG